MSWRAELVFVFILTEKSYYFGSYFVIMIFYASRRDYPRTSLLLGVFCLFVFYVYSKINPSYKLKLKLTKTMNVFLEENINGVYKVGL